MASRIKVFLLLSREVPPKSKALVNFKSLCWFEMQPFPKLCLNLCSLSWLKPSLSRGRSFIPLRLWQLSVLLADGLMNDKILFLKVTILSKCLISQSNLFHSIVVEGKKVSWKSHVLHLLLEFYYIALFCMTYCVWE